MSLLTKVKTRLALHARRPVHGLLDGQYASRLSGRSLDFADLREYRTGDDVADVDWKASARHGELLVKRYVADRKHTVLLVVDTGREMSGLAAWGEQPVEKRDLLVVAAGVVGWLAVSRGDYVGLVHNGTQGPVVTRPSTRELELERMLQQIRGSCGPETPRQETPALLEHAVSAARRRAIMFVLLGDVDVDGPTEGALRRLAVQHELTVITVADLDPTLPGRAGQAVQDAGTDRRFPAFAATSATLAEAIRTDVEERAARRDAALRRLGVTHVHLADDSRVVQDVLGLVETTRRAR